MSLEFTKLSEVAVAESISENASVLVEDGGEVKRTPYSWNTLNGRPFGESPTGGDTLTWDGNTEGLVNVQDFLFKVSERTPTIGDFANGGELHTIADGTELRQTIAAEDVGEVGGGTFVVFGTNAEQIWIVPDTGVGFDYEGIVFPESGIYFLALAAVGINGYIASLAISGYTGFPTVKQIESKYIPPLTQDKLPAGYPWDGRTVIEWDGNTEGLLFIENEELYKVSDAIAHMDDLANGFAVNYVTEVYTDFSFSEVAAGVVMAQGESFPIVVVFVAEEAAGVDLDGMIFPESGVYTVAVEYPITITYGTTTPISETLLPESVKRVVVNVTLGDTITADKTYAEVITAAKSGAYVVGVVDLGFPLSMPMNVCLEDEADGIVEFSTILFEDAESIFAHGIIIHSDNTVEYIVTPIPLT